MTEQIKAGQHRATYATDKFSGGFNIRVIGPFATRFAGREVPVTTAKGEVRKETLDRLIWSGTDTGVPEKGIVGSGKPVAIYSKLARPFVDDEIEF
jgi:hypothetical protein